MLRALVDAGVLFEKVAKAGEDTPEVGLGPSITAENIVQTLTRLDRQVSGPTGHTIDLRLLIALTVRGLGLWQASRAGLGVASAPAIMLLWYAFAAFWKFPCEPTTELRHALYGEGAGLGLADALAGSSSLRIWR